jgi:hypothetical protein
MHAAGEEASAKQPPGLRRSGARLEQAGGQELGAVLGTLCCLPAID